MHTKSAWAWRSVAVKLTVTAFVGLTPGRTSGAVGPMDPCAVYAWYEEQTSQQSTFKRYTEERRSLQRHRHIAYPEEAT